MATDVATSSHDAGYVKVVDAVFDRLGEYFPPPVFVGRMRSTIISAVVALCVLFVALVPAYANKKNATTPMEEIAAIGVIVGCVVMALYLQQFVAGIVYNFDMHSLNRQHFANTHWVRKYTQASASFL